MKGFQVKYLSRFKIKPIVILCIVLAISITLSAYAILSKIQTRAVSANDYNYGRIIDDEIFYNKDAMSKQQIQDFLDKSVGWCDIWGEGEDIRGIKNRDLGRRRDGENPPYICINKYMENPTTHETSYETGGKYVNGGLTAAEIIYQAAQENGINPQVLLVMLRKESIGPVLYEKWPYKNQYKYAMGYACPDSGPGYKAACDSKKAGFYNQMKLAAWQLKYYKDNYASGQYAYNLGWNDIQYSPNPACGKRRVYIENVATLSLYIYTPYVPNSESLNNYPGTARCGAYGNRNFFMMFNQMFGSTYVDKTVQSINQKYNNMGGVKSGLGYNLGWHTCNDKACYQLYTNGYIIGNNAVGYWPSLGGIRSRWAALGYEHGTMGLPLSDFYSSKDNGQYQQYQNGYIIGKDDIGYWESKGSIRSRWAKLDYERGILGYPTGGEKYNQKHNSWFQQYQNGAIIGKDDTGYWENKGSIRDKYLSMGGEDSILRFPTSGEKYNQRSKGWHQDFENGSIYGSGKSGFWPVKGEIKTEYLKYGADNSQLGYPISAEIWKDGKWSQKFENGTIIGNGGKYKIEPN